MFHIQDMKQVWLGLNMQQRDISLFDDGKRAEIPEMRFRVRVQAQKQGRFRDNYPTIRVT